MKKAIGVCVLLAAAASPAHADREEMTIGAFARWLSGVKEEGRVWVRGFPEGRNCMDALDKIKKSGVAAVPGDTDEDREFHFKAFGGKPNDRRSYDLPFAKAEELCREVAVYEKVLKDYEVLARYSDLEYEALLKSPINPSWYEGLYENISECFASVDAVRKAVPATLIFGLADNVKTVGDLDRSYCEHAKGELERYVKHLKAQDEEAKAPFLKVGIKGDKLDLMLQYDGELFLTGGSAPDDLRKYAKASTMFLWLSTDPDDAGYVTHTIRKFHFKGNKLVKTTEKTYRKKRGEQLGSAVFR